MTNEHNPNQTEDMARQQMENSLANKTAKKVGQEGKKQVKKIAKKAVIKGAKMASKLVAKAVMILLKFLLPILIIAMILFIVFLGIYYVSMETTGSEQEYTTREENPVEKVFHQIRDNVHSWYYQTQKIQGLNKDVNMYYKYMAQNSFYQIMPGDKEQNEEKIKENKVHKFKTYEDTDTISYHKQELKHYLNSNVLFLLDRELHEGLFIYPEQFIQPLFIHPATKRVHSLVDKDNVVKAYSRIYITKGEFIGQELPLFRKRSVSDYGLAPVFTYKKDKIIKKAKGKIVGREYFNEETGKIEIQETNEDFEIVLDGYPEEIHVITDANTIDAGFQHYEYKRDEQELEGLSGSDGQTGNKVAYGSYTEQIPETVIDDEGNEQTIYRDGETHVLYEYREGAVYLNKPVPDEIAMEKWYEKDLKRLKELYKKAKIPFDENAKDEDFYKVKYFDQYVLNYEGRIPFSVMNDFDFDKRTGGKNVSADFGSLDFEVGTLTDSEHYKRKYQEYFPTFKKWGDIYGVDPDIVFAQFMQESNGGELKNHADGPLQIPVSFGTRPMTAKNVLTGEVEKFSITIEERQDLDKSVRYATGYFQNKMTAYENELKALQSYNFDIGIIKQKHPDDWENGNEWMKHIEEARNYHGSRDMGGQTKSANYSCMPDGFQPPTAVVGTYGDACYISNTLRYYNGTGVASSASKGDSKDSGTVSSMVGNRNVIKSKASKTSDDDSDVQEQAGGGTILFGENTEGGAKKPNEEAHSVPNPLSLLAIVNKDNKLDADFKPDVVKLHSSIPTKNENQTKLRKEAADAFKKLFDAAQEEGIELGAFSGYRSFEDQGSAYINNGQNDSISAKAGYSEHQTGLALDVVAKKDVKKSSADVLVQAFGETKEGKWLANNAHKFGFIIRYPKGKENTTGYNYEPWHIRFLGVSHATNIDNEKITLEEAVKEKKIDLKGENKELGEDFDIKFEDVESGMFESLLRAIVSPFMPPNYKEEKHFFIYRNHKGAVQLQRIKESVVAYNQRIPFSMAEMDEFFLNEDPSKMFSESNGEATGSASGGLIPNDGGWIMPFSGNHPHTCQFGNRNTGIAGATTDHQGVDFGMPSGTPLYAVRDGVVSVVSSHHSAGNYIEIQHKIDGEIILSRYLHLQSATVKVGQKVKQNQQVALSGNTGVGSGPHLHFELRRGKDYTAPAFDPITYIIPKGKPIPRGC